MTEMFNGKKILFFSASFFGYQTEIKNKLIAMGAEVDLFDERPKNTFTYKALIRIDKRIVRKQIEDYYRDIIEKTSKKEYDYVFFLKAEVITLKMLKGLKQQQSKAKFILYLWDSIKHCESVRKLFPVFNKILSFDYNDSQKHTFINFQPLFYLETYSDIPQIDNPTHDIVFIGTAHLDRYGVIKKMKDFCKANKIKNYFFVYLPDPKIYFFRKLISKDFRKSKKEDFSFNPLNGSEVKNIIENTMCVLDIEKGIQSGQTMRAIEVLGAKRKLITTNAKIKNYDFYNENNICVIDRNNPSIPLNFLKNEYEEIDQNIYEKYSLGSWLGEVFSNTSS